jgi:His/Glu/Gln/Arg/opine family amino acid ABC transporter permease subunit
MTHLSLDLSFFSAQMLQEYLLQGLLFSLQLTVVATAGGMVLGTMLALLRLSDNRLLSLPAAAYVNLMRSVPLVMVLLWFLGTNKPQNNMLYQQLLVLHLQHLFQFQQRLFQ